MDAGLAPEVPNLEIADWDGSLALIEELTTQEHPYKTLVIDVIDGLEKLANEHVCQSSFGGDWSEKGFMGFHRGFKVAASGPWRSFLAALDKLRAAKLMGIILLAHTGTGSFQNPTGPDYNRYAPDMYKDAWQLTYGWADIVLFANREPVVQKERGQPKGKASGALPRTLYTEWSPFADAKNRHNLPDEIDMGNSGAEAWHNFTEALKAARQGGKDGQSNG